MPRPRHDRLIRPFRSVRPMLTVPDLVVPRPVMHHRAKPTREVSGPRGHVQVKPREPAPPHPSPSDTSCRAGHPRQAAAPSGQRMRMRRKRPPEDSGRGCARPPRLPRRMPRLDEAGRGRTPALPGRRAGSRPATPRSRQRRQAGRRPSPRRPLRAANAQRRGAGSAPISLPGPGRTRPWKVGTRGRPGPAGIPPDPPPAPAEGFRSKKKKKGVFTNDS